MAYLVIGNHPTNVAPNYTNTAVMKLADTNNNYQKSYEPMPNCIVIPQNQMMASADSENAVTGNEGPASNVLDGSASTIWHTQYQGSTPVCPHYIELDLGGTYTIGRFTYLPRTGENGRVNAYEVQINDGTNDQWTTVASGNFPNSGDLQIVDFVPVSAAKIRLLVNSSYGNPANTFCGS